MAAVTAVIAALILVAPANALSINRRIKVEAGAEVDGASAVNERISVGEGATLVGHLIARNTAAGAGGNTSNAQDCHRPEFDGRG